MKEKILVIAAIVLVAILYISLPIVTAQEFSVTGSANLISPSEGAVICDDYIDIIGEASISITKLKKIEGNEAFGVKVDVVADGVRVLRKETTIWFYDYDPIGTTITKTWSQSEINVNAGSFLKGSRRVELRVRCRDQDPYYTTIAETSHNFWIGGKFTLSPDKSSKPVVQGNSIDFAITVNSLCGYSEKVTLSCLGKPPHATCTFSQNPVTPSGESTLTIQTSTETPVGTYPITIYGTGGDPITVKITVDLEVEEIPEFTTITIPVAAVFGLLFLISRRRKQKR